MTAPDTAAAPTRQTTRVISAMKDAHAKPSAKARYLGGFFLIMLSAGLLTLFSVFAKDLLKGVLLWAIVATGAFGILALPIMEVVPAMIRGLTDAISPLLPWNRGKASPPADGAV